MKVQRAARVTINQEFETIERFVNEYVANISRSGVFVRSKDPLPAGTTVNLRFTIILEDMETIEGVGKVVRVSHHPPGMGIAFIELTERSQQLIQGLLKNRPHGSDVTG